MKIKFRFILLILLAVLAVAIILALFRGNKDVGIKDKGGSWIKRASPAGESPGLTKNLSARFGFLGGGEDDSGKAIIERGAGWVRPHPGAFLWDAMQEDAGSKIDFSQTDSEIKNLQKNNLEILVTLWGFADWDQENRPDAADCKVWSSDEFLPHRDKKGRGYYLPEYRCNPNDWQAHNDWVKAAVERYDGDGQNDLPGLQKPIKYWEVMNEPDLNYKSNLPAGESGRLTFYKQGPADYGELLKNTSTAIKAADPAAKVLIAGAAGGEKQFLSFYELLFMKMPDAPNYFDIGNVHCISNDRQTADFNVNAYKKMLAAAGINKPIWVTEAEAMYGGSAPENFESTQASVSAALSAGAEKIFFTRYEFDDFRPDISQKSQKTKVSSFPSAEKYREIIESH